MPYYFLWAFRGSCPQKRTTGSGNFLSSFKAGDEIDCKFGVHIIPRTSWHPIRTMFRHQLGYVPYTWGKCSPYHLIKSAWKIYILSSQSHFPGFRELKHNTHLHTCTSASPSYSSGLWNKTSVSLANNVYVYFHDDNWQLRIGLRHNKIQIM